MQYLFTTMTFSVCMFFTLLSSGQSLDFLDFTKSVTYRFPTAAMIDGKVCNSSYFTKDKTKLAMNTKGNLTIASVSCGTAGAPIKKIPFQVAIKNDRTNTMWIFTKAPVETLKIEDILLKCELGDRIILMPSDQKYTLPENEMHLLFGC